jgi:hypothetical protein
LTFLRILLQWKLDYDIGTRNYFGSANPPNKELRDDFVCMHYHGMGRHLFIDVDVVEPVSPAITGGARSSAEHAGVAAALRAQKPEEAQ